MFYYNTKRFDESIQLLNKSIELDSLYKNSHQALISNYLKLSQEVKVKEALINAIHYFEDDDFIYQLIMIYLEKDDLNSIEKYIDIIKKNTKLSQEIANEIINKGVDAYEDNRNDEAVKCWKFSLKIQANNLFALQNIFQYYLLLEKDFPQAKLYSERIISLGGEIEQEHLNYLENNLDN